MMPSVAEINHLSGHAHNPRGNLWFNDESTYGHKLLMKMGWNKGKGLGKNEDGIKENIKVKFRNTNSGLGFKDDAYTNVMKTEYESILKNLSAEYSSTRTTNVDKKVVDSDEDCAQKSKIVKSKLRYPKLFFGKDVTKYSEKDMKSIFICSVPLKSIEEKSEDYTYNSNLSVADYFANKMQEKRNNTLNKKSSNSAIDQQTENFETLISAINENMVSKRKGKDSQTKIKRESPNIEELNEVAPETEIVQTENLSLSIKKSSRKIKKEPQITEDIEINSVKSCTLDIKKEEVFENPLCNNISHNICAGETITDQQTENSETLISAINQDMASKRKGKDSQTKIKRESPNIEELNEVVPETEIVQAENLSLSIKKSSRKRKKEPQITKDMEINSIKSCALDIKKEEVFENPLCNNISHNICAGETIANLNSYKPNKKRKLSQLFQDDGLETSENTFSSEIKSSLAATENRKKKKCKTSVQLLSSSENSMCIIDDMSTQNEEERSNHLSLDSVQDSLSNNTDSPRKKKKSKRKLKEKLKSCLKNKHGSYSLKNVSFNETVSYRIIDSETESIDSLNCESVGGNSELIDSDKNNSADDAYSEEKLASNEYNLDNNIVIKEEDKVSVESNQELSLSDLPSSKSSHYNAWIESQRLALKMELYKKMLKSIKKHKILKTTNLLSIKGYGNWGYE